MQFPNLVYKTPGPHKCKGGSYGYRQVNNLAELQLAIDDGFYPTKELAINPPECFSWADYGCEQPLETAPEAPQDKTPEDDAPPTRDELEAKAKELGISFNGNTKDTTLMTKIDEALAEQAAADALDGAPE